MAKILTEGFFDEPVCSMNNSCNTEPCKVYKFNFIIQFPGGFEEEILDSCKACSEEEASDIFSKTYDLSGGKVVIDPAYEEDFNVALESMKKKSLKEDISKDVPEWLYKELTKNKGSIARRLGDRFNVDTMKYTKDTFPVSNRDPRLKDPHRLNIYRVQFDDRYDPGVYIPDVVDNGTFRNYEYKPVSKLPMKDLLANTIEFGYIDLTDENNLNRQKKLDRINSKKNSDFDPNSPAGRYGSKDKYLGQHKNWRDQWFTEYGRDKSGYKLDPTRLQRKLDNVGFTDASSRIESFYNQLEPVRLQIIDLLSNVDVKNLTLAKNTNYTTNVDIIESAMRYYSGAVDYFKSIKDEVDKIVDQLKNGNIGKVAADSDINYVFKYKAPNFREALKNAKEQLKRL